MKRFSSVILVVLLLFTGITFCLSYPKEPYLVKIADLSANPINYDQKFIAVMGRVTSVGTQPSLQLGWYDLTDDTGTIAIITTINENPKIGDELWVSGTITNQTKRIGQRDISFYLQEKNKEHLKSGDDSITVIELWIGNRIALVDRKPISLDTAPVIINSRTLVPLRFISENFGASIDWDSREQKITLTLKK